MNMAKLDVKLPAAAPSWKDIRLIPPTGNETNGFTLYDIDLTKLGADEWIGLSVVCNAPRMSFDTYDHTLSFLLSTGVWKAQFILLAVPSG